LLKGKAAGIGGLFRWGIGGCCGPIEELAHTVRAMLDG
jgi:hypothetical protein